MPSATRSLRRSRALILATFLGASALALTAADAAQARKPAPNIVVIVTDDQPESMMDARALPSTFKRLVDQGTSFTDAIATTPLCCPSRAALLTGQYGHNNGVLRNDYRRLLNKRNVLPSWLQAAGYRTAHVGRYLNGYKERSEDPAEVAAGWDIWHTQIAPRRFYDYDLSVNGKRRHFGMAPDNYLTRVVNRRSARIATRLGRGSAPFYLQIDHLAPHRGGGGPPPICQDGALPDVRDTGAFFGEPLPSTPSFDEAEISDKPSFIASLPAINPAQKATLTEQYRCGLASLRAVDRGVERVMNAIENVGEMNRTVFIFTSDHGYLFGEHRIRNLKHFAYEESLQVPLVIRAPKRFRRGAERIPEVDLPVANIDLAPTILRLARGEPCWRPGSCRTMDGRSLLPLLRGPTASGSTSPEPPPGWPVDRALALELALPANAVPRLCSYQGVRTAGAVYIQHETVENQATGECEPASEVEHYDLLNDPFQLDNLYPGAAGSPLGNSQQVLAGRLARMRDCAGIDGRDPLPPSGFHCQ